MVRSIQVLFMIIKHFVESLMLNLSLFLSPLDCLCVQSGGGGFHNSAVIVTPQDIAPTHSGSVFGLMNTFGSIARKIK